MTGTVIHELLPPPPEVLAFLLHVIEKQAQSDPRTDEFELIKL